MIFFKYFMTSASRTVTNVGLVALRVTSDVFIQLACEVDNITLMSRQCVWSSVMHSVSQTTCSHKEDASTEQDVVLVAVDAAHPDTQAS